METKQDTMRRAALQPAGGDNWRIEYDPSSRGMGFGQALLSAAQRQSEGDVRRACDTRFTAFQTLAELIPEDEQITLDWDDRTSRDALEVLHGSALDHFLAAEWEMAAAMLEMLLDLDPEDHLEATRLLAWCYVVLQEWELFDEALSDMPEHSVERTLLALWAAWRREGKLPVEELALLRGQYADWFREFTAAEHPVDESFLQDIDSEHPSTRALARELWLQTEHIWAAFPGFIEAINDAL